MPMRLASTPSLRNLGPALLAATVGLAALAVPGDADAVGTRRFVLTDKSGFEGGESKSVAISSD
ncbi:MAG: hypothetical protein AAGA56_29945, partial [Myxococcota bacterium]